MAAKKYGVLPTKRADINLTYAKSGRQISQAELDKLKSSIPSAASVYSKSGKQRSRKELLKKIK